MLCDEAAVFADDLADHAAETLGAEVNGVQ